MSDVFISYARSNAAEANAAAEALRAAGYSVWLDEDLPAHRPYAREIEAQLKAAKAALVIWSEYAVESEWVLSEANRAREDKKLVQVSVDGVRLPMPFDQIQCADLTGWKGDVAQAGWRKVVDSVAALAVIGAAGAESAPKVPPFPAVRYARSGEFDIAYLISGQGPIDIVIAPGMWSHLEALWPLWAPVVGPLSRRARVIMFDKRGQGMSDRMAGAPTLEERMDDIRAVMDAAGSRRAVLWGLSEGGPMSVLFAATHPDRVLALIVVASFAKLDPEVDTAVGDLLDTLPARWGQGFSKELIFPDAPISREQCAQIERLSSTPANVLRQVELAKAIDVRPALPAIGVPTLVMHRDHDSLIPLARAREVAEHIPGARLVVGPGGSHAGFDGEGVMAAGLAKFLASLAAPEAVDEQLATVLVCDRELENVAGANAERLRGKALATSVGSVAYVFDGPTRAVECAMANRVAAPEVAQGLTLGIVALRAGSVGGPAPEQAAHIAGLAAPGEILLSRTLRDVLAGTRFELERSDQVAGDQPCYRVVTAA